MTIPGFFPELEGVYYDAENPIDYEQHPLRGFLSPVTGEPSPLAVEMQRVWTYLQDEHPDSASANGELLRFEQDLVMSPYSTFPESGHNMARCNVFENS